MMLLPYYWYSWHRRLKYNMSQRLLFSWCRGRWREREKKIILIKAHTQTGGKRWAYIRVCMYVCVNCAFAFCFTTCTSIIDEMLLMHSLAFIDASNSSSSLQSSLFLCSLSCLRSLLSPSLLRPLSSLWAEKRRLRGQKDEPGKELKTVRQA